MPYKGLPKEDFTGKTFGRVKVLSITSSQNTSGEFFWECRCRCGKELLINSSRLKNTKSCGCWKHRRLDITGRKSHWLTVTGRTKRKDRHGNMLWKCKCKCGKVVFVQTSRIKNKTVKSCGCYKSRPSSLKDNLVGEEYGRLTVLRESNRRTKGGGLLWECECECGSGNLVVVTGRNLKSGNTKSCGCLKSQLASERRKLNMKDVRVGRLVFLRSVGKHARGSYIWLAVCDCGNVVRVQARSGKDSRTTRSCGCLQKDRASECSRIDITGRKFGKLIAVRDVGAGNNSSGSGTGRLWECLCDCGNIKKVIVGRLVSLHVQSCGCMKPLSLEAAIERFGDFMDNPADTIERLREENAA